MTTRKILYLLVVLVFAAMLLGTDAVAACIDEVYI